MVTTAFPTGINMDSDLSRVVDALPGLAWTALPNGDIDFLNQRWREYTGLASEEAMGQGWLSAVHPDDLPKLRLDWYGLLPSAEPIEVQARLRRFDGVYRWFQIRISACADESGQAAKWCGVGRDIGDNEKTHSSLRGSDDNIRLTVVDMPSRVARAGSLDLLDQTHRNTLDLVGNSPEVLADLPASAVIHPQDRSAAQAAWGRSLRTGVPYDFQARQLGKDGAYRWHRMRGLPLLDTDGQVARWCFLQIDIDDQKRIEALRNAEEQLLEIVTESLSMPQILDMVCRLVEGAIEGCYCSIVLVDSSSGKLEHGAAPSLPATFIQSIVGRPVNLDSGPCAMAAFLNEQIIACNLETETRWEAYQWPSLALRHGLKACWSTPISTATCHVVGAFAIYYSEPKSPTDSDLSLISQIGHIASITIERYRSQATLRRALDELGISEARLRTIIDAIPGFAWSAAADGDVDFVNQRWCEYTGVKLEDASGSGWQATIHPGDIDQVSVQWRASLRSGHQVEIEARMRRFDGTYRWFLIRAVPMRDGSGAIVKWYGQNTDIEDRKRAETILSGEKKLLEMIAGDLPLPEILRSLCELVESTADGCHCSILLTELGDDLQGVTAPVRLLHAASPTLPPSMMAGIDGRPVGIDSFPCAMAATLNTQVVVADIAAESRWDLWRPVALSHGLRAAWSTPIASKAGTVLGTFAILYREPKAPSSLHQSLIGQFTHLASIAIERARGIEALSRSQAFLLEAQRLSATGSFSWRVHSGDIQWSDQVYRIFEVDRDTVPTFQLIESIHHPDDLHLLLEAVGRAEKGVDVEYEHRLRMRDGRIKYLHTVAHCIRERNGDREYIGAIQDVTERRLSEEALSQTRADLAHVSRVTTLGALTASIAHEVNQPLSGIITNASTCLRMLGGNPPNIEGAKETARRTIRDGTRASEVIGRLRGLFRKKPLTAELIDLNEIAREVIALSSCELQAGRVVLRTSFADELPLIVGDRVQLQQVILNLLLNASDAMAQVSDRQRKLLVKTEVDELDHIRLSVVDSGVGIEAGDEEKLFEAFYTTKPAGMGIGLSISRTIIESHHGQLSATPNCKTGSTFFFSIPRGSAINERLQNEPPKDDACEDGAQLAIRNI